MQDDQKHNSIKVLLVESNPSNANIIQEMLKKSNDNYILINETHLDNILISPYLSKFNIILLNLFLKDTQGINTLEKLILKTSNIPTIIFNGPDDQELALKAIQTGAEDYLIKDQFNSISLIRAMHFAIERFKNKSKELSNSASKSSTPTENIPLTFREKEILSLISEGRTNKEISNTLVLSTSTVRNHVAHIFSKLKISNRTQAATYSIKNSLNHWNRHTIK